MAAPRLSRRSITPLALMRLATKMKSGIASSRYEL